MFIPFSIDDIESNTFKFYGIIKKQKDIPLVVYYDDIMTKHTKQLVKSGKIESFMYGVDVNIDRCLNNNIDFTRRLIDISFLYSHYNSNNLLYGYVSDMDNIAESIKKWVDEHKEQINDTIRLLYTRYYMPVLQSLSKLISDVHGYKIMVIDSKELNGVYYILEGIKMLVTANVQKIFNTYPDICAIYERGDGVISIHDNVWFAYVRDGKKTEFYTVESSNIIKNILKERAIQI